MSNHVDLLLHPKQALAFESEATEIFFGGAAGGGKSHILRVLASTYARMVPKLSVGLFRRSFDELIKTHIEGPSGFRNMLSEWLDAGSCEILTDKIRFNNGSFIYLCHCHDLGDEQKYKSYEFHLLLVDELTTFTEAQYRFLRSRVRLAGVSIPKDFKYPLPKVVCASNPGDIGHGWVRKTFVSPKLPFEKWKTPREEGGFIRQFIPSRLEDNPSNDADYELRLYGLGSKQLVNAYRFGDWSDIEGQFFGEFGLEHQIEPIELPEHWNTALSMDWGSFYPFSIGWHRIVGEEGFFCFNGQGTVVELPPGSIIRTHEWYGATSDGKGLELEIPAIARGIKEREPYKVDYRVLSHDCFKRKGGPSIAEQFANQGIYFRRADPTRVPGWAECRRRLRGEGKGPLFYVFTTCPKFIEIIPELQHDAHKPEDASQVNDHIAEDFRYMCMSRPLASDIPKPDVPPVIVPKMPTINELWERREESRRNHW